MIRQWNFDLPWTCTRICGGTGTTFSPVSWGTQQGPPRQQSPSYCISCVPCLSATYYANKQGVYSIVFRSVVAALVLFLRHVLYTITRDRSEKDKILLLIVVKIGKYTRYGFSCLT